MREVIERRFQRPASLFLDEPIIDRSMSSLELRDEYEKLHDLPIHDPDEREALLPGDRRRAQPRQRAQAAMDEWCAVWFWPTDEESLRHVPTPLTFHRPILRERSPSSSVWPAT